MRRPSWIMDPPVKPEDDGEAGRWSVDKSLPLLWIPAFVGMTADGRAQAYNAAASAAASAPA
jgi:hypothetical protein